MDINVHTYFKSLSKLKDFKLNTYTLIPKALRAYCYLNNMIM